MKRPIALGAALVVLLAAVYTWIVYVEPKLSLFEPSKVATNFRQMARIFPTVAIPASSRPRPLSETPSIPVAELAEGLPAFLARSRTTSLLVLHNGRLIHESYYEGYDAQSQATSFSVAKTFVSTLIGIALAEGAIASLDDPVVSYRPDLAASGFAGATLKDLLQMSSGIAFSEVYDDPTTDAFTIYDRMYAEFASIDQVAASFGSAQPAGASFHYASINTHALAMVLEAATGKSLADYLHEKLWEPLGSVSDASWITDVRGGEVGFWGFNARPRDFARLGQLYLQDGVWDGAQLITREWVESSTRAERDDLQRGRIAGDWGYQHHWWLPRGEYDDFSAIGIWGQFIYVNRDLNLVVVKTSADPDFKAHEFEAIEYFRRIGEHLAADGRAR